MSDTNILCGKAAFQAAIYFYFVIFYYFSKLLNTDRHHLTHRLKFSKKNFLDNEIPFGVNKIFVNSIFHVRVYTDKNKNNLFYMKNVSYLWAKIKRQYRNIALSKTKKI